MTNSIIYVKFLLVAFLALFSISAEGKSISKRWIQETGFGEHEPEDAYEKREAVENESPFPKFPGDQNTEQEFEQEFENDESPNDKGKIEEEIPIVPEVTNPSLASEEEEIAQPQSDQVSKKADFSQQSQSTGFGQSNGNSYYRNDEEEKKYKPWYHKVGSFFKKHNYLKEKLRNGRSEYQDDYYINP